MSEIVFLLEEPSGTLARLLSLFPFSAAQMIVFRSAMGAMPPWELAVDLAVLAGSTWLSILAGARLFRLGMLLYGKKPTPREILRCLRNSGSPAAR